MGHEQGPAKSVCGAMRRQALRRLRGEQEAELGIGLGRRDGDEDAGLRAQRVRLRGPCLETGDARLFSSIRPLRQRVDGDRHHRGESDQGPHKKGEQAPVAAARLRALTLERPVGLVARPPRQHRVGEDVVEDLPAAVHGAENPMVA